MQNPVFTFSGLVWEYQGPTSWYFVTVPKDIAAIISEVSTKRGWGSVKVKVTVGDSTWESSVFPDKKLGNYLLPLKKQIRIAESIDPNTERNFIMQLI